MTKAYKSKSLKQQGQKHLHVFELGWYPLCTGAWSFGLWMRSLSHSSPTWSEHSGSRSLCLARRLSCHTCGWVSHVVCVCVCLCEWNNMQTKKHGRSNSLHVFGSVSIRYKHSTIRWPYPSNHTVRGQASLGLPVPGSQKHSASNARSGLLKWRWCRSGKAKHNATNIGRSRWQWCHYCSWNQSLYQIVYCLVSIQESGWNQENAPRESNN